MLLYNVLLYLRCSAETAKINVMVFLFMLYCVVEPKCVCRLGVCVTLSNHFFPKKSLRRFNTRDGALFTLDLRYFLQILGYFRTAGKKYKKLGSRFICLYLYFYRVTCWKHPQSPCKKGLKKSGTMETRRGKD